MPKSYDMPLLCPECGEKKLRFHVDGEDVTLLCIECTDFSVDLGPNLLVSAIAGILERIGESDDEKLKEWTSGFIAETWDFPEGDDDDDPDDAG